MVVPPSTTHLHRMLVSPISTHVCSQNRDFKHSYEYRWILMLLDTEFKVKQLEDCRRNFRLFKRNLRTIALDGTNEHFFTSEELARERFFTSMSSEHVISQHCKCFCWFNCYSKALLSHLMDGGIKMLLMVALVCFPSTKISNPKATSEIVSYKGHKRNGGLHANTWVVSIQLFSLWCAFLCSDICYSCLSAYSSEQRKQGLQGFTSGTCFYRLCFMQFGASFGDFEFHNQ
ncbi:hypothetical protein L1887_43268 [Cichorium endivia]|nr:hypothetical protein L1887_43268 [Cichorium endivia]